MTRQNLCPNPALKNNASGWFSVTREAETGMPRPWSGKSGSPDFVCAAPFASVVPGTAYTVSAYVKTTGASSATFRVEWQDAAGNAISTDSVPVNFTSSDGVLRPSVTAVAPSGAERAVASCTAYANTRNMTAVLVEQGVTLDEYFDGDSPDATWDGTDGNSTSTLTDGTTVTTGNMFFLTAS